MLKNKKIYLIRHGETEFNRLGLVQGSGIDSNLNDLGVKQARAFYKAHSHVAFDKIYVSALKRTYQTALPFIEKGTAWQKMPELNEISWGTKEGRVLNQDDDKQHLLMMNAWKSGNLDARQDKGESPLEVAERQKNAIHHILSADQEGKILICMHGRAMKIFLCQLLHTPLKNMDMYEHSNVCLYVLNYDYFTQTFTLEVSNDQTHLESLEEEIALYH